MRIVNFLLAIMFMVFAFVQVNDPDPIVWILIYGVMAVICVLAAFEFYRTKILIFLLLAFLIYGAFLYQGVREWLGQNDRSILFDDLAKMKYDYIEEAREFLGLMICVAVLLLQLFMARRRIIKRV